MTEIGFCIIYSNDECVGYDDDIGGLLGALAVIVLYIDSDTKQKAKDKVVEWFCKSVLDEVTSVDDEIEKKKGNVYS